MSIPLVITLNSSDIKLENILNHVGKDAITKLKKTFTIHVHKETGMFTVQKKSIYLYKFLLTTQKCAEAEWG